MFKKEQNSGIIDESISIHKQLELLTDNQAILEKKHQKLCDYIKTLEAIIKNNQKRINKLEDQFKKN
ncbi:MAG: hypothetical protein PVH88_09005 [Ignavibacteria bacterium]|jgi:hypothetical protein